MSLIGAPALQVAMRGAEKIEKGGMLLSEGVNLS